MKRVDRIVFFSFLGPLILTLFVADMIFLLQFLWKYIDELVGKGLETKLLLELMGLFSITMIPMALPLAILLSSTMILGRMGEDNELTAFKSSGLPLLRIMESLILFCAFLSFAAFYYSNTILPNTMLKFYSLLWDIRQSKPALDIKEGVFYRGIEGFTLRIEKKDPDNRTIYDIMVYDHTTGRGADNVLMADKGEIGLSGGGNYLILDLYNGKQIQEVEKRSDYGTRYNELLISEFKKYHKVFDLSQFKMSRSDQNLFKNSFQMFNVQQLRAESDTILKEMSNQILNLRQFNESYISISKKELDSITEIDTMFNRLHFNEVFKKKDAFISQQALANAQTMANYADIIQKDMESKKQLIRRHRMEIYKKFTLSAACIILLFIGAPMGAIIRKGGFGLPILVSVLFYLLFHVLNITGTKLSENNVVSTFVGMWLPAIILFPIGLFVTFKAQTDSTIFRGEAYVNFFRKIIPLRKKGEITLE